MPPELLITFFFIDDDKKLTSVNYFLKHEVLITEKYNDFASICSFVFILLMC